MLQKQRVLAVGRWQVPASVRKRLGLKEGDEIAIAEKGEDIVLLNPSEAQAEGVQLEVAEAFEGLCRAVEERYPGSGVAVQGFLGNMLEEVARMPAADEERAESEALP
ncbi:MAG: AbrB/MazE/SpoVT family DNA-binding domain-containing protein [Clostridiales Family XIII bacterium]|jgi:AbrB family looped-hinge helix DNA binding protein|nr:AbrB/MazE/SpoVT family DNA-binding domain-containing protein [Clostridiales Family XIII bacterium]